MKEREVRKCRRLQIEESKAAGRDGREVMRSSERKTHQQEKEAKKKSIEDKKELVR